eukprot:sb/3476736/
MCINISPSLRSDDILHISPLLRKGLICGNNAPLAGRVIQIHTGVIAHIYSVREREREREREITGAVTKAFSTFAIGTIAPVSSLNNVPDYNLDDTGFLLGLLHLTKILEAYTEM